jgi:hypothetical protein
VFAAWSVIVIEPERVPVMVGVNVTLKVQLPPAFSMPTHVLAGLVAMAKSPLGAIEIVVFPVPVLLTVTCWLALVVPTRCEPNPKFVGVGATITLPVPVPVKVTFCGEPDALSAMEIEPVRVPVAVGVNVTVIVQLSPAFTVEQVFVSAKSPLGVTDVIVATAVPVLFTVTTWPGLVVPIACDENVKLVGEGAIAGVGVPFETRNVCIPKLAQPLQPDGKFST